MIRTPMAPGSQPSRRAVPPESNVSATLGHLHEFISGIDVHLEAVKAAAARRRIFETELLGNEHGANATLEAVKAVKNNLLFVGAIVALWAGLFWLKNVDHFANTARMLRLFPQ
jgi:hypothetical protein